MNTRPRKSDDSSMFWFVRVFVMFALGAVLVIGLGFLLPEERTALKTTLIDAPTERVYLIVTDVEKQVVWRSDVKSVHVERRGDLWAWTEDQNTGTTLTIEETAKSPQKQYEFKYVTTNGMRGRWSGQFEALNEGRTKLTLTQTVVIENPLRRVAAFILLNLDTMMDVYLGDLNRYASQGEPALDPLLRPSTTPRPTPTAVEDEPLVKEPAVEPTPSATAAAVPSAAPTATPPSAPPTPSANTPPSVSAPPSVITAPSVNAPPSPVPTSTSITLPSPTSLPPNTPSLLTPSPTPSATPTATPTSAR